MALYQGKRKTEALAAEGEAKDGPKAARMLEEEIEKATMSNANGYWMRPQHIKQEVAGTPPAAQLSYQQRIMAAAALQEIRTMDSNGNSSRQVFRPPSPRLHHLQQAFAERPSLVDCSVAGSHSLMNIPNAVRSPNLFSDPTEVHTSAAVALAYTPPPVLGSREMQSTSSLAMSENQDQYLNYLLLNKNGYHRQQNGVRSSGGFLVHDQRLAANAWFSCPAARDSNPSEPHIPLPGFHSSATASDVTDQSAATLTPCTPTYRDLAKEPEHTQASGFVQPRMLNHSMLPPNSVVPGMRTAAMSMQAPTQLAASTMADIATTSNYTPCNGATEDNSHSLNRSNAPVVAKGNKAPVRTYIKVYKRGSIGRALDVRLFSNYTELRCELGRMFGLEGRLDQKSGWQVVFTDDQNELLLMGDDPWEEFVKTVRKIQILSPSEVAYYMNWDEGTATVPYSTVNSTVMKRL